MTTNVLGYLVKPATRTIELITCDGFGFREIAAKIESGSGYIDMIRLNSGGDVVYVDDEGRLNGAAEKFGKFWVRGSEGCALVVGNGLVLGTDDDGDTCTPGMTMDVFTRMVEWDKPADNDDDGSARMSFIHLG